MPPADWKSAVEIHPANWECPVTAFWVAGWVTSPSLVPVDVRAWLGRKPFLGLCGLPRPDKEAESRGHPGPPQAGFSFLLKPVAGARQLVIEVCDQHGRWTEIFRHGITCPAGSKEPTPPPASTRPLLRLLRAKHARPNEGWRALAAEILVAESAEPFDVMPSPPFHGALEEIADLAATPHDHLLVTGWLAHREQRIVKLTAFLDTATAQPLVHGLSRPDTTVHFADLVDAAHARFAGYLRLPLTRPRPLALRIFAELADGRTELVFLKRFRPVLTSGQGTDLTPFSRWRLIAAAWALRQAGWDRGWPEGKLKAVLRDASHEYRTSAPTDRLPPQAPAEPRDLPARPLRVTLVTHNLNFEGAPLFLSEYARHLAAQPGWSVRVVSAQEGPLRANFESAGLPVTVLDASTVFTATDSKALEAALDPLVAAFPWADCDVIVANTLVAFWAVLLAHRLRKPSLFYIHESVGARRFFALQPGTALAAQVERAFGLATRVAFPAAAGQLAHAAHAGSRNFRALSGWTDVAKLRAYPVAEARARTRCDLGIADHAVVFSHLGSLLPRKGLHVLLEAIAHLQAAPAAGTPPLVFLLVGAKPGIDPYVDTLRHTIATRGLRDVRIIEQSPDPGRYFAATDIFVCASLEEVFPRVVMEAAVFSRLIVSTNVNGIPEMLGPDEAWLVPPDDPTRLAAAMREALAAHQRGDFSRAERAQRHVSAECDAARLLPQHLELLHAVAASSVAGVETGDHLSV